MPFARLNGVPSRTATAINENSADRGREQIGEPTFKWDIQQTSSPKKANHTRGVAADAFLARWIHYPVWAGIFPVLISREFAGKAWHFQRKGEVVPQSWGSIIRISLYFPAKQGKTRRRQVRR